jgi:hypothetical protein
MSGTRGNDSLATKMQRAAGPGDIQTNGKMRRAACGFTNEQSVAILGCVESVLAEAEIDARVAVARQIAKRL